MKHNLQFFLQALRELRIPYYEHEGLFTISFKVGTKKYLIRFDESPFNCSSSVSFTRNKYCVNQMLTRGNYPTPKMVALTSNEYKKSGVSLKGIRYPVIVKPVYESNTAFDIIGNIQDEALLHKTLKHCFMSEDCVLVEEFHAGLNAFKVLLFAGKVIGVVERLPAKVVGDGSKTIAELIETESDHREKKAQLQYSMLRSNDYELINKLQQEGRALTDIPAQGDVVTLTHTCNTLRGATVSARAVAICPGTAEMLARASERVGLQFASFDLLCQDITQPFKRGRDFIIGIDGIPDVSLFEQPAEGEPTPVVKYALKHFVGQHHLENLKAKFLNLKILKSFYFRASLVVAVLMLGYMIFLN